MLEFHHVGIPTQTKREGETYLEDAKLYVTDVASNPHCIEWLRFEDDSPMPDLLKTKTHVAYKVANMDVALVGKTVLIEPFTPMEGVTVAFVLEEDDTPIEYMQVS